MSVQLGFVFVLEPAVALLAVRDARAKGLGGVLVNAEIDDVGQRHLLAVAKEGRVLEADQPLLTQELVRRDDVDLVVLGLLGTKLAVDRIR